MVARLGELQKMDFKIAPAQHETIKRIHIFIQNGKLCSHCWFLYTIPSFLMSIHKYLANILTNNANTNKVLWIKIVFSLQKYKVNCWNKLHRIQRSSRWRNHLRFKEMVFVIWSSWVQWGESWPIKNSWKRRSTCLWKNLKF